MNNESHNTAPLTEHETQVLQEERDFCLLQSHNAREGARRWRERATCQNAIADTLSHTITWLEERKRDALEKTTRFRNYEQDNWRRARDYQEQAAAITRQLDPDTRSDEGSASSTPVRSDSGAPL